MLLISYPACEEETTIILYIPSYAGEIALLHEINNCETPSNFVILWRSGSGVSTDRQSGRHQDLKPRLKGDDRLVEATQTALERSVTIICTAQVYDPF